ncbi:UvrD-helicase domain-containing protein [Biformimicrobium ophioploci]|uniref:DNA 3'-5' helicase n=1 Tax=Biformimicrobium ophioploci TaxID=3036711 RepID=A0ABQ6M1F6_9GAMM|nr:UvrD-helicase domain-containing protein [Microbulbifer sp. NKW57]GMG88148.1 UvrD-helicase domain-containing protein [Microbulbifer sp. NKW57]
MTKPADFLAREAALDISSSFAVSAPAGSGKTGLLTQRVLKLLSACEAPEEVLAITFTRKAAGEMRERIIGALQEAASTSEKPQDPHAAITWELASNALARDRKFNWQLIKSPHRLRLQTIDGLCRALASQLPVESGMGAPGEPLEQPESAYEQAVMSLYDDLRDEEEDGPLRRLLEHVDNDLPQLSALLVKLLANRDQWLPTLMAARHEDARAYFQAVIEDMASEALTSFADVLAPFASELALSADFAGNTLNDNEKKKEDPITLCAGMVALPACEASALPLWHALIRLISTTSGEMRKPGGVNVGIGFPATDKERKAAFKELLGHLGVIDALPALMQEVRALPREILEEQWQVLQALTEILPRLVAKLTLVFRQLGATDFIQVAQGALQSLGDPDAPTDLTLKLDANIRHILVDEFQDTSSSQLELLHRLTAGWQPGDGRSLFIVGDGMQSCYGFRNANVGIFLNARENGVGELPLNALDLTVNFRSQRGIVDWVNECFRHAFPPRNNIGRGAVRYSDSVAFRPPGEGNPVRFHGQYNDSERLGEAQKLVELVQQARTDHPDDTIAILARNRPHLRTILASLTAAGLNYYAADLAPLASRMLIQDLLSLTRALQDPADRISWLAILRAPWCGLTLADLHCIAGSQQQEAHPLDPDARPILLALQDQARLDRLSEHGRQSIQRCLPLILQAWNERQRKPLRQTIEGLWVALGGPAATLNRDELENAGDFFQLLEKHDQGGVIPEWKKFERALEKLYARPAVNADPQLQVMTIHKSKGLEFDHVFIPGLDLGGGGSKDDLLRWGERIGSDGAAQFLLAPKAAKGDEDPLFRYLGYDAAERERLEATRVLYVGCTRAIKKLHLFACLEMDVDKKTGETRTKAPGNKSLLHAIWPTLAGEDGNTFTQYCELMDASSQTEQSLVEHQNNLFRLKATWKPPEFPQSDLLAAHRNSFTGDREPENPENLPPLGSIRQEWIRHAGTVAHSLFEILAARPANEWQEQAVEPLLALGKIRLRQCGLSGQDLMNAHKRVQRAVFGILGCDRGRWILDPSHQDARNELAIYAGGRQLRRSVIDRTFIDRSDGTRWIIDYKVTEPGSGQEPGDFFAAELQEYSPQLERYRRLFAGLGEKQIRCALYFPLLGQLLEP